MKGHLLLDGGALTGSFFHRAVVLICDHSAQGAFGLVLNRPSENRLEDVLPHELPDKISTEVLYAGGPVQPAALSYLHCPKFLADSTDITSLLVGHDLDQLRQLGEALPERERLRVFAGYAGWAPGQLENEMAKDAWLVEPATLGLIFHQPADELWRRLLLRREDWRDRILAEAPDDLSWN